MKEIERTISGGNVWSNPYSKGTHKMSIYSVDTTELNKIAKNRRDGRPIENDEALLVQDSTLAEGVDHRRSIFAKLMLLRAN